MSHLLDERDTEINDDIAGDDLRAGAVGKQDYDYGMRTIFEAAGGKEGLQRLADAWHRRVVADEVVSHAFSHGFHPQHVDRLAAYWAEALGGPRTYSESYGDETAVVRMHSGKGEHEDMDRRAIACFDQALIDAGLADDDALRQVLHDYFAWATTTTMSRYHKSANDVPSGLGIPQWSWNGLEVALPLVRHHPWPCGKRSTDTSPRKR